MEKKYQVFVSSTYADLEEERGAVIQAVLEQGCIPSGMELFPAANDEQWVLIQRVIEECDYYVVIVAGRYGSLGPAGLSYTEMEYRYALQCGKPVMGFVHEDPASLPLRRCEQSENGQKRLEDVRNLVMSKICKRWSSAHQLGSQVKTSLNYSIRMYPTVGWVRGNTSLKTASPSAKEFFKRNDYPTDLKLLLNNSKSAIFWGTAFTKFVPHMRDDIESRLTHGLEIRFFLVKPDGAALGMVNLRGRPEDITHRRTDLERNLAILKLLASKAPPGRLELRVLDYLAPYTMVAFDPNLQTGRMFVWLAAIGVPNTKRPMFELTKNNDPEWFDFFTQQFELTWEKASEP